jgi:hypothetical protein
MITIDITTILSIVATALSACALIGLAVQKRALNDWRRRCLALEGAIPALRHEVELIASVSAHTGRQIKVIKNSHKKAERGNVVELHSGNRSVSEAIDSARRGTDSAKLSQQFGLSRGEADLIARLHGNHSKT